MDLSVQMALKYECFKLGLAEGPYDGQPNLQSY